MTQYRTTPWWWCSNAQRNICLSLTFVKLVGNAGLETVPYDFARDPPTTCSCSTSMFWNFINQKLNDYGNVETNVYSMSTQACVLQRTTECVCRTDFRVRRYQCQLCMMLRTTVDIFQKCSLEDARTLGAALDLSSDAHS